MSLFETLRTRTGWGPIGGVPSVSWMSGPPLLSTLVPRPTRLPDHCRLRTKTVYTRRPRSPPMARTWSSAGRMVGTNVIGATSVRDARRDLRQATGGAEADDEG